jgi:hypothetical protein
VLTACAATRTVGGTTTTEQFKGTLVMDAKGTVTVRGEQRRPGTVCKPSPPGRLF